MHFKNGENLYFGRSILDKFLQQFWIILLKSVKSLVKHKTSWH